MLKSELGNRLAFFLHLNHSAVERFFGIHTATWVIHPFINGTNQSTASFEEVINKIRAL